MSSHDTTRTRLAKNGHSRPALRARHWPPADLFRTPAGLLSGANLSYLAYYRPAPRPFFVFASGHFPPGTPTRVHSHPCVAMHGCLQGPITLATAAGDYPLDAGMFCLLPSDLNHHWRNAGPHTAATISFQIDADHPGSWSVATGMRECCRDLKRLVTRVAHFTVAGDPDLQQAFWALGDHLMSERPCPRVATLGLLCTFLAAVLDRLDRQAKVDSETDVAREIRRLLLSRICDHLTIEEVARHVLLSPTRAKELFRKTYGCGIIAYFNQLKIWQAKRLLCDPSLTVEQVSYKLGFSNPSYFCQVFHRHTGQTPTVFRGKNAQL